MVRVSEEYRLTGNDWSWKPPKFQQSKAERKMRRRRRKEQKAAPKIKDDFYRSWEWKQVRFQVLKYYGAVCMLCHSPYDIVVDHIKSRREHPELALSFDNLQVLCDSCNRGKGRYDESDFRPLLPEPEIGVEDLEHLRSIQ
jgi:5-methylcytosine-specific restriction endonuclease McrA